MAKRIIHRERIHVRVGAQPAEPQPDIAHAPARSGAYRLWGLVGIALFIGLVVVGVGSLYQSRPQQLAQRMAQVVPPTATPDPTPTPLQSTSEPIAIRTERPETPDETKVSTKILLPEPANIALHKPITIQAKGNERQQDSVNNVNDGNPDSAAGWVNDDYNQEMVVETTIDLQRTYDISKIRYTVGNVMRDSTWAADLMETPFGQIQPIPGRQNWTEQTGHVIASKVKLVFHKTRTAWERDWLFIGEIEIYGVSVASALIAIGTQTPTLTPTSTPTPPFIFIHAPQQADDCIQPPYGLVSWWPGDGNADDIIAKNNGKLVGGVKFTDGMVGQAFHFDGINDIVMAMATGLPAGAAPRTVAFWAKTDPSANNAAGFGYGDEAIGKGFYIFPTNSANGGRLTFSSHGPSGIVTSHKLRDGQYHYIAVTYDGSTATVYTDGVTVTSRNLSLDTGTSGGACIGGRCYLGEFFKGEIDEVAVWKRALSTSEIETMFKASSAGMCKLKK